MTAVARHDSRFLLTCLAHVLAALGMAHLGTAMPGADIAGGAELAGGQIAEAKADQVGADEAATVACGEAPVGRQLLQAQRWVALVCRRMVGHAGTFVPIARNSATHDISSSCNR